MVVTKFMATTIGRGARIVLGIVLIVLGLLVIEGTGGVIVAVVGIVPILAGVFDVCLIAPIFGAPFSGKANRESK